MRRKRMEFMWIGWLAICGFFTYSALLDGGVDRTVLQWIGALVLYVGLVPLTWNLPLYSYDAQAFTRLVVPALAVIFYVALVIVGRRRLWRTAV